MTNNISGSIEKNKRVEGRVSSAVLIEDNEKRLLLLQQGASYKNGEWGPPSGGIEAYEDPIQTAHRETMEEIGVQINIIDLIGIYTRDRGDNIIGIGFVFRAKIVKGEINIKKDEIKDYAFFGPIELDKLIKDNLLYAPDYNLNCISDWRNNNSYPIECIKPIVNNIKNYGNIH